MSKVNYRNEALPLFFLYSQVTVRNGYVRDIAQERRSNVSRCFYIFMFIHLTYSNFHFSMTIFNSTLFSVVFIYSNW